MTYWDLEFNVPQHEASVHENSATQFQETHLAFIAAGLCPACKVTYDECGFCSICGFSVAKERGMGAHQVRGDSVPHLPVPLDEFAPAAIDEDA